MSTKKTLLVVLLYMVLVIGSAAAATSGTLVIRGYVPETKNVQMLTETSIQDLDLDSESGETLVGTIKERSTTDTGYKVEITSSNATSDASDGAYLVGGDTGERIDYQIMYAGEAVELTNGQATVANSIGSDEGQITVAYDAAARDAASCSDTLTLSVIAN